jgi:hypothetical protein
LYGTEGGIMTLSDFGVREGDAREDNFSKPVDPEWTEFDAKVAERKAKLKAAMKLNGSGHPLPKHIGIKDLISISEYEEEAINSILSCVDPDDVFGLLEDLNFRDKVTFIAVFVVGRSI